MSENVVLLHGFSGTRRAWDGVAARLQSERYLPRALDLPGHGDAADAERPITFTGCVEHVLARSPKRFVLGGYSLGGRVALHVALAAPERVTRLVLVSTSAGIEGAFERAARSASDSRLADELERGGWAGFDSFIERWRTQPLFADEPPEVGILAREDQCRNRPDALAAVLRGIGSAQMKPLWDRLTELELPVTVLVGDRDAKFLAFGKRMVKLLPESDLLIVPGGHGLPLENPEAVARAICERGSETMSERIDPEPAAGG